MPFSSQIASRFFLNLDFLILIFFLIFLKLQVLYTSGEVNVLIGGVVLLLAIVKSGEKA